MVKEFGTVTISAPSLNDDETDAIALCLEAMRLVKDANAKARVASYLAARFLPVTEVVN